MFPFLFTILALADPASNTPRQSLPQPIEQGIGDVNPLSQSQRALPVDLFVPTRFEKVYKLQDVIRRGAGLNPTPTNQPGFVRFSGGVAAVFPFSTYEPTARGNVATIPAGTVFHLDLRPVRPGDVRLDASTATPSYNAVPAQSSIAPQQRSLAAPTTESAGTAIATPAPRPSAGATRRDATPRSLTPSADLANQASKPTPNAAPAIDARSRSAAPAASLPPRLERLTPWSKPAMRERVLDGLIDALVAPDVAPSVTTTK
jgi:hypothetical protein